MVSNMTDDDIQLVVERFSACKICNREHTKLCEESVDYLLRSVYFATPFRRQQDAITKYCKYFKLSPSKLAKALGEMDVPSCVEQGGRERAGTCTG
jgi:hypothetical protein